MSGDIDTVANNDRLKELKRLRGKLGRLRSKVAEGTTFEELQSLFSEPATQFLLVADAVFNDLSFFAQKKPPHPELRRKQTYLDERLKSVGKYLEDWNALLTEPMTFLAAARVSYGWGDPTGNAIGHYWADSLNVINSLSSALTVATLLNR